MKHIYLVLTILGAVIPYLFFYQFMLAEGGNLVLFVQSLFANGAAGGFSADLFISSFVFWMFMFQQARYKDWPKPALYVVLNLFIGLSCALPAYLYSRERIKEGR